MSNQPGAREMDLRNLVEFVRTDWDRAGPSYGWVSKRTDKSLRVKLKVGRGSMTFRREGDQWVKRSHFSSARYVVTKIHDEKGRQTHSTQA